MFAERYKFNAIQLFQGILLESNDSGYFKLSQVKKLKQDLDEERERRSMLDKYSMSHSPHGTPISNGPTDGQPAESQCTYLFSLYLHILLFIFCNLLFPLKIWIIYHCGNIVVLKRYVVQNVLSIFLFLL